MTFIETYKGKRFYPFDPKPEMIDIEDIAHSLALRCRFGGQCKQFYSVAQHSLYVAKFVERRYTAWGLFHDAAEAYIADIPTPLKIREEFRFYRDIEANIMRAICERFGLPYEEPNEVKIVDKRMLITEINQLMFDDSEVWKKYNNYLPYDTVINPFDWQTAEQIFLSLAWELGYV